MLDNINFLRKYMRGSVGDLATCCEYGISSLEVERYPCYLKNYKLVSFVGLLHLRQLFWRKIVSCLFVLL